MTPHRVFGGAARALRTPDPRTGRVRAVLRSCPLRRNAAELQTETQTSNDVELGLSHQDGPFRMQTSIYNMDLENEIHFDRRK
jgi:iron complex outermembrane receptor protein